jgi:hypothetical protein
MVHYLHACQLHPPKRQGALASRSSWSLELSCPFSAKDGAAIAIEIATRSLPVIIVKVCQGSSNPCQGRVNGRISDLRIFVVKCNKQKGWR